MSGREAPRKLSLRSSTFQTDTPQRMRKRPRYAFSPADVHETRQEGSENLRRWSVQCAGGGGSRGSGAAPVFHKGGGAIAARHRRPVSKEA